MILSNNVQKGKNGEKLAEEYLKKIGYKITGRNWHYSKNAEIDIIAIDRDTIVFVEVKTRSSLSFGHPFESINHTKLQKIHKAIYGYLNNSDKKYNKFRIDAIAVIGLNNPKIEHLKNIGQY